MQDILTIAINSIALASIAYLAIGLVLHLASKFTMPYAQLEINFAAVEPVEPLPVIEPLPITSDPWTLPVEPLTPTSVPLFPVVPNLLLLPAARSVQSVDAIVPFKRRQSAAPDWSKLTPAELRKVCQQRGIRWRDAHGKSKHLKKSEMLQLLSAA
jgi:hypothetical protein